MLHSFCFFEFFGVPKPDHWPEEYRTDTHIIDLDRPEIEWLSGNLVHEEKDFTETLQPDMKITSFTLL